MSTTRFIRVAPAHRVLSLTPRGRRTPAHTLMAALTLSQPSAIVTASPFAPRQSPPFAYASPAAPLEFTAAAFNPQARPLAL